MDEAVAWSYKALPPPQPKPSALPAEPTPEEERMAWQSLEHMPRSSKEILSQMLGNFLSTEQAKMVELQCQQE